jgi:hypothetical protein
MSRRRRRSHSLSSRDLKGLIGLATSLVFIYFPAQYRLVFLIIGVGFFLIKDGKKLNTTESKSSIDTNINEKGVMGERVVEKILSKYSPPFSLVL